PKQFLPLVGNLSLLEQTLVRAQSLNGIAPPIIVCNEEHRFLVAEQLRNIDLDPGAIILEPVGRNTAPAVAVAAFQALKADEEAVLLVMPADHVIQNIDAFSAAVSIGMSKAVTGKLVTFGIIPESPETGYGYIRRGDDDDGGCYAISEFVEKPELEVAKRYIEEGNYYWNSGMFLLSARTYLNELQVFSPEMYGAAKFSLDNAKEDMDFIRLNQTDFESCPSDSIDYAVMEKTSNGMVVPLSCGWSDVGSWSSLWEVGEKNTQGNVIKGDVIAHDSSDSYIHSTSRLVTLLGMDNVVVVETADAILVANKDRVQDIKAIISQLKTEKREEVNSHTKVYRPWGSYESLVVADRFQVKRIIVTPGQQLSLQMHHHRAEHWIVVSGTAMVTCGEKEFVLSEDQSTYIPLGTKHRLANNGVIPLELIEVQSGSYLGEDDIVRFEDVYGRSS
ncbi:MAG: mannose-1-phosphate guanylyltransferase/mannose-6-phosphate isomerase, partial [Gammaproteobacteria bacterium]